MSLVVHGGKVFLRTAVIRFGSFGEEARIFPDEERGFWRQRTAADMMWVVRRLRELRRASNVPLHMCFIEMLKGFDSVDHMLLWAVLAQFGVPPRMIKFIRMVHDGTRSRAQPDAGELLYGHSSSLRWIQVRMRFVPPIFQYLRRRLA